METTALPSPGKRIAYGLLTGLLALLVMEGVARLALSSDWVIERLRGTDDASSRLKWIRIHAGGKDLDNGPCTYDPVLGWRLRAGFTNADGTVTIGPHGGRAGGALPPAASPRRPRILLLGDSFTFGDEVRDGETYAHYLQTLLPGAEVLNLGVSGYGHDQMLLLLREQGPRWRPDVVILGFVYLDLYRNLLTFGGAAKPRFAVTPHGLSLTGTPVPAPRTLLRWEWARPKLLDLARIARYEIDLRTHRNDREARRIGEAILDEMADTIVRIGAVPVFAYFPDPWDMATSDYLDSRESFFLDYSRARPRIRHLSLRPVFQASRSGGPFPGPLYRTFHWSPQGHETAAHAIRDCLAANDLLGPAGEASRIPSSPMDQYTDFVLQSIDRVESNTAALVALAEKVADRHLAGGVIGVIWEPPSPTGPQGPQYEIKGRSGGLSAMDVALAKRLREADRTRDVAIIGWQRAPSTNDLDILRKYAAGHFVIAFGPRARPDLQPHAALCDAWIDTGLPTDDTVIVLSDGVSVGRGNALINALNAWAFQAELVAALTRRGRMPTLLKSHVWPDSADWNERYRGKKAFHDDLTIAPVAPGILSRRYLDQIRNLVRTFAATQKPAVVRAADLIVEEQRRGRKTIVAQSGHTTYERVGKYEDAAWAAPEVLYGTPGRLKQYPERTPDGALVLRLGYSGLEPEIAAVLRQKHQRVVLIASNRDERPEHLPPQDLLGVIDTGWEFGDACVRIEGYPIKVFPPSGIMQLVAYESVNAEVLARLATLP